MPCRAPRLNSAVSCAPDTAYFRSKTKNGTPVAPKPWASAMSALTSASKASRPGRPRPRLGPGRPRRPAEQLVTVADPDALGEVAAHQPFGQLVADALGRREVQQPVRPEGVGRMGILQLEVQPDGRGHVRDPVIHRPGLRQRSAVLLRQHLLEAQLGGRRAGRIQLERPVGDAHLVGVRRTSTAPPPGGACRCSKKGTRRRRTLRSARQRAFRVDQPLDEPSTPTDGRPTFGVPPPEGNCSRRATRSRPSACQCENAAAITAACSTSCTRADPADGAAIARREIRLMPVSLGIISGRARARNVQAPWFAGSSCTQRKSVTSG